MGHDDSTCFSIHGTPDWWYEKCGHKAEDGTPRGRGRPPPPLGAAGRGRGGVRANATPTDVVLVPRSSGSVPAITIEQWHALFATFGNASTTPLNRLNGMFELSSWIIDTGCTHHVAGDLSFLCDVSIDDCPVGLPNGASVLATQSGTVHLSDTLVLHNVLYDLHLRALIGTGERRDGLYYLRDVKFMEDVFPYLCPEDNGSPLSFSPPMDYATCLDWDEFMEPEPPLWVEQPVSPTSPASGPPAAQPTTEPWADEQPVGGSHPAPVDPASIMGRGMRSKLPSTGLKDFITCTTVAPSPSPSLSSLTPSASSAITAGTEPRSFKEAMRHPEWHHQTEGLDYNETFVPVAKMVTVRANLAIVASKNWELHHMDVHNAFLHGDLSEEVYMKLPSRFTTDSSNQDLGVLKYFLGLEVARSRDGIFCANANMLLTLSQNLVYLARSPLPRPSNKNHQFGRDDGPLLDDPEPCRRLMGRLIYLVVTRPDLTYVVHVLSQFMHAPTQHHLDGAHRIVRYLKGCPGQGILLHSDCDQSL
ncbi:uncharacterized protein LOC125496452 [Beta vulgaris subsp. vulgaris]|uniref:uncharacterized protein LOC125496452 n=1 Tax=Beta vulgaris subsp. vulgaris TaxID=3555 RepID=UPI002036CC03|nr:uncharacterized protein LOC125496452 [Beta vulgaris subsp. vulgaris]